MCKFCYKLSHELLYIPLCDLFLLVLSFEVTISSNMADGTSTMDILLQSSLQKQFYIACNRMKILVLVYTQHEVKVECGLIFLRHHACLSSSSLGRPLASVSHLAKNEYDAREDVAMLLIRRLLGSTERRICDYNYYNVQILYAELQKARDEKFELNMKMEIVALKAEIELFNKQH
ncbi:hypothetical protein MtrunA17_Chr1g0170371 [Medicago truncatula]|uniref:Uncharacterized protein n=2 Tax=Medicago truncatula TaxID=3880 RepID=A0A396JRC4_MEDTR|nr:hypothetical protein MtrunA17_Chr1g0170371 [Medicago truncatula]